MKYVNLLDICNPKQWKTIATSKLLNDGKYDVYGANGIIGKYNEYNHKESTVLITCRGATCGNVHLTNPYSYINGNAMCLDDLDETKCLKEYLYYFLKGINLSNVISGSAQPQITIQGLKKINVKICDISEQKDIVDRLKKIDYLISSKKEQIKKMNELVNSQFIEMFGDPVINDKKFVKAKLFDRCDVITGNTPSRKINEYYGDYIEWIKSDNIYEDSTYLTTAKESLSEKGLSVGRFVDKDAILMTCIAGSIKSIGNVAITNRRVSFNQQINGIIPKDNNVYFMYEQFILSKDYLHTPVNMSLKGILSKNQLGNLEFIFPPIELQNKFGEIFKKIEKQKSEFKSCLEKLEELQSALMQEYFE